MIILIIQKTFYAKQNIFKHEKTENKMRNNICLKHENIDNIVFKQR